jgi:hypothetical protein
MATLAGYYKFSDLKRFPVALILAQNIQFMIISETISVRSGRVSMQSTLGIQES